MVGIDQWQILFSLLKGVAKFVKEVKTDTNILLGVSHSYRIPPDLRLYFACAVSAEGWWEITMIKLSFWAFLNVAALIVCYSMLESEEFKQICFV